VLYRQQLRSTPLSRTDKNAVFGSRHTQGKYGTNLGGLPQRRVRAGYVDVLEEVEWVKKIAGNIALPLKPTSVGEQFNKNPKSAQSKAI
jgi:hypothetical protein